LCECRSKGIPGELRQQSQQGRRGLGSPLSGLQGWLAVSDIDTKRYQGSIDPRCTYSIIPKPFNSERIRRVETRGGVVYALIGPSSTRKVEACAQWLVIVQSKSRLAVATSVYLKSRSAQLKKRKGSHCLEICFRRSVHHHKSLTGVSAL
jgi:hypothetical protein